MAGPHPPNDPEAQAADDAAAAAAGGRGGGAGGALPAGGSSPPLVALPLALSSSVAMADLGQEEAGGRKQRALCNQDEELLPRDSGQQS